MAPGLPLWACWEGESVLLPVVLGELADTPEVAPAPARRAVTEGSSAGLQSPNTVHRCRDGAPD